MKKNCHQKLIKNLRELQKQFITLMTRFKANQIKTKSAETKTRKKGRAAFPTLYPIDHSKIQIDKSITPAGMISQILPLLAEGKIEESLKIHRPNGNKASKSRFLNALNHAENNHRNYCGSLLFTTTNTPRQITSKNPELNSPLFNTGAKAHSPPSLKRYKRSGTKFYLK